MKIILQLLPTAAESKCDTSFSQQIDHLHQRDSPWRSWTSSKSHTSVRRTEEVVAKTSPRTFQVLPVVIASRSLGKVEDTFQAHWRPFLTRKRRSLPSTRICKNAAIVQMHWRPSLYIWKHHIEMKKKSCSTFLLIRDNSIGGYGPRSARWITSCKNDVNKQQKTPPYSIFTKNSGFSSRWYFFCCKHSQTRLYESSDKTSVAKFFNDHHYSYINSWWIIALFILNDRNNFIDKLIP